MIQLDEVLKIHKTLIDEFGGLGGVRETGLLQSAIQRPYSGFGKNEFYPTPEEKAAAILESIIKNHPFIDGNKRTGYVLMRLTLIQFGKDIKATQDEKFKFVIRAASGKINYTEILNWIQKHSTTIQ